jgi:dTDP-4-amino-4,6-dideoxygalactose transaminase
MVIKEGDLPVSEKVGQTIVSLPLFPSMSENDQERVIRTMQKIFGRS